VEGWQSTGFRGVSEGDGQRLKSLCLDDGSDLRRCFQPSGCPLDTDLPDAGGAGGHHVASVGDGLPCSITEARVVLEPPEEHMGVEQEAHGHK
jgi:hypothetical protein